MYGASLVTQMVKNPPAVQKTQFSPWVGKTPWRRKRLPTLVFLPREFHEQRSHGVAKESDMTERLILSQAYSSQVSKIKVKFRYLCYFSP